MAVPVALNLPINNAVNLSSDIGAGSYNNASNRQFSEHFDNHVDRLKDKGHSSNSVERNKAENVENKRSTRGADDKHASSKSLVESSHVNDKSTRLDDRSDGSVVAENGQEEATGLPLVATAMVDEGALTDELSLSIKGGNSLPIAAETVSSVDVAIQAIDETFLGDAVSSGLGAITTDIVFDPLAQATDSSSQIASMLVSSQLPVDKIRLNGKAGVGDFLNPFNATPALDKAMQIDISALMSDKLFKADSLTQLGNEFGLVKSTGTAELPLNNVAGVNNQSINMTPLTADKPTLQLDTPMNSTRWGQEFGQRIQWMVNQSVSGAQIRITPQNMGPIEVRVQMQNDQATIAFTAQHGATREAIDAALPRLREMLSDQNVNVVDVDISQHSFAEQRDQQAESQNADDNGVADGALNADGSIFDQQENNQQRQYNGLFSDFA